MVSGRARQGRRVWHISLDHRALTRNASQTCPGRNVVDSDQMFLGSRRFLSLSLCMFGIWPTVSNSQIWLGLLVRPCDRSLMSGCRSCRGATKAHQVFSCLEEPWVHSAGAAATSVED